MDETDDSNEEDEEHNTVFNEPTARMEALYL